MKVKLTTEEEQLQKQGYQLKEMADLPGWRDLLRPWLQDKINHSWLDPRKVKDDETLLYEYKVAWAFAQAAQEILDYIQKGIEEAEYLTKKERGEIKDSLREALK